MDRLSPRRRMLRSSSTRKSFVWIASGALPDLVEKEGPPLHPRGGPCERERAVNAPLT